MGGQGGDLDADGFYVNSRFFLTGENKPYKGGSSARLKEIKGVFNYEPGKRNLGAWELLTRYETMRVDDNAFDRGLNWYPNNMVAVKFNYVHNDFDNDLNQLDGNDQEDLFLTRFQVKF